MLARSLRFSHSASVIRISTALVALSFLILSASAEVPASQPATATSQPAEKLAILFGLPVKGKKIVFIVEHSGSMLDDFRGIQAELTRAVNNLNPDQHFTAVCVSEDASTIFKTLQSPTPQIKKDFAKSIAAVSAQGQAAGMLPQFQTAFETAFALKPDAIYFITAANYDPQLVEVVKKLNPKQAVPINVLLVPDSEPTAPAKLKKLAEPSSGAFVAITDKDVHR